MTNLVISHQIISQDKNGFYSLNDLHCASGSDEKHRPTWFMRNQQTKDLITEIENEGNIAYHTVKGGNTKTTKQGTYVCRELVYAYAMWISASFYLMVIRTFDSLNTDAIPALQAPKISISQAQKIQKAIKQKCQYNSAHYQTLYHALYDEFHITSYKELSAADFDEAMSFIDKFNFRPQQQPFFLHKQAAYEFDIRLRHIFDLASLIKDNPTANLICQRAKDLNHFLFDYQNRYIV
ncbi:MAG: KilA-N domain-containing protein [Moraxella sp.]